MMGINIKYNKLVIKTELKAIHFGLLIESKNCSKYEIDFIMKQN